MAPRTVQYSGTRRIGCSASGRISRGGMQWSRPGQASGRRKGRRPCLSPSLSSMISGSARSALTLRAASGQEHAGRDGALLTSCGPAPACRPSAVPVDLLHWLVGWHPFLRSPSLPPVFTRSTRRTVGRQHASLQQCTMLDCVSGWLGAGCTVHESFSLDSVCWLLCSVQLEHSRHD